MVFCVWYFQCLNCRRTITQEEFKHLLARRRELAARMAAERIRRGNRVIVPVGR